MNSEVQTCGKPIDTLVERVVSMNILSSDYFKELYRLKTYSEVVDEIFNHVDHVEPWMTGNCRGSSTAFCLLYKFFTMKLTVKQMHGLLGHHDSAYIRAIGFLYLRYVADPKTLWQWFEPYIEDAEEFSPGTNGRTTTMGTFIRDLLLNQYYFSTIFPRIPVPIVRQITGHLERLKLPTTAQGSTGTGGRHGSDETARRPPSVKAALSVSFGQRAPHRASTRDSSPVRRSLQTNGGDRGQDRERPREKERERGKDRDYERERPKSRDSDYDYRRRRDDNERDRRDRRDLSSERDRYGDRSSERDRYGDRSSERDRYRDRSSERDRYGGRYRSRSRSRSPRRSRTMSPRKSSPRRSGSPSKEKEKEKSGVVSANLLKLRDVYGDASGKLEHGRVKDSSGGDVIRLGGPTWR